MPSDLPSLYLILGKTVVWFGLGVLGTLLLGLIVMIAVAVLVQTRSVVMAKRYTKHWALIENYVGWKKGAFNYENSLHEDMTACLNDGAAAYEATPGDKAVKMHAAMHAWCASIQTLRKHPGMPDIFHPLDLDKVNPGPTPTTSRTIVGTLPEDT